MSDVKLSLIDLGDASQAAVKLIETIEKGVGSFMRPTQIRREAKALADAKTILFNNDLELRDRAEVRRQFLAEREQANIEEIAKKAASSLPEVVSSKPVDADWAVQFMAHAQDISDDKMQLLWAKILAGETASPGSFSVRTLQTVKGLSKTEAELFTSFARYLWVSGGKHFFVRPNNDKFSSFLAKKNLKIAGPAILRDAGLLDGEDLTVNLNQPQKFSYFDENFSFSKGPKFRGINLITSLLTAAGEQLSLIAKPEKDSEYLPVFFDSVEESGVIWERSQ